MKLVFVVVIGIAVISASVAYFRVDHYWKRFINDSLLESKGLLDVSLRRLNASWEIQERINSAFRQALVEVDVLRRELRSRRFSQFWDIAEGIATRFAAIKDDFGRLEVIQREHSTSLNGRNHNLPEVLPQFISAAQNRPTVEQYQGLLQIAEADIDFAVIWEHRQTRAVVASGFSSLGSLVGGAGMAVLRLLSV